MREALAGLFTFGFSNLALWLACLRLTRGTTLGPRRAFVLSWGAGPLLISWLLTRLLLVFPGRSDAFYEVVVVALFGLVAVTQVGEVRALWTARRTGSAERTPKLRWRSVWPLALLLLPAGVIFGLVCFYATAMPLYDNDPLEYATIAQLFYTHKSVSFYPILDATRFDGLYFPSSHPLGFPGLITWMYLGQGHHEATAFVKLINPMFLFYTLCLGWAMLGRHGRVAQAAGSLALLAAPFYLHLVYVAHVDPMRLFAFLLAFAWLTEALDHPGRGTVVGAGLAVGLSMYTHSIGVLTLPFFLVLYVSLARTPWKTRLWHVCAVSAIALLLTGYRYWENYRHFGSPIRDDIPVYSQVAQLQYSAHVRVTRGIDSPAERVVNGLLKGFSKPELFGHVYWILLATPLVGLNFRRRSTFATVAVLLVGLYYAGVVVSLVLGMDVTIMNDRYMLTVHPFTAALCGCVFGEYYEKYLFR